jgi:pimeloyl-ACP methyl ester carboxylesterase
LQFSIDYPEYVDRLVLINTAARLIPAGISVGMYFGLRFILGLATNVEFQAPIIAQSLLPGDDYRLFREYLVSQITESDSRAYRRTILSLASFNELGRLAQIKSPTLVVTGENDSTIPPALQKRMADRISGSLQKQVPKAGHAIIVQRPDEVNHLLGNFLRS